MELLFGIEEALVFVKVMFRFLIINFKNKIEIINLFFNECKILINLLINSLKSCSQLNKMRVLVFDMLVTMIMITMVAMMLLAMTMTIRTTIH